MNQDKSAHYARRIREEALKMVAASKASHLGGALSCADILAVLYLDILRIRPEDPLWESRDRLVFSKGHCCSALYAALALRGFFGVPELQTYAQDGSRLMAHASHKVPGVEFSTGSLGHGLPFASGKALAAKRKQAGWRNFVILSDGEMDEGSNWEAILFGPHHGLDNLIAILDYNKIQSLGTVASVLAIEPLREKITAFSWAVKEVDGHNHRELLDALATVPWVPGKPSFLIAHTTKGKGVDFMENQIVWHYKSPNPKELEIALSQLRESI